MAEKINSKRFPVVALWVFILILLVYTRFVNLGWGLPHPMHPDERNMANSIMQLGCVPPEVTFNLPKTISGEWDIFNWVKVSEFDVAGCFNPNFFAYGQFPLYLGYLLSFVLKFIFSNSGTAITFEEATLSLRIISATASVLTVFVVSKLVGLYFNDKHRKTIAGILTAMAMTFTPYAIQFAHFGTTESLLMLYYSALAYLSVKYASKKITDLSFVSFASVVMGVALATKVSSAVFIVVPFIALFAADSSRLHYPFIYRLGKKILDSGFLAIFSVVIFLFLSPHILLDTNDFIGTLKYESDVALGRYIAFYTRQFVDSVPVVFQVEKIFPYALGLTGFVLFVFGFFWLSWSNLKTNILRLAFLSYFLTNAFMFAKWSRFMAPVFPLMTAFAVLFISNVFEKNKSEKLAYVLKTFLAVVLVVAMILPGVAYLSVYTSKDVRVQASEWIYDNIPEYSYILSETANVVDIPMYIEGTRPVGYTVVSFNFYDLDQDPNLQEELGGHLNKAEYIFVPSRRLFSNHRAPNFPIIGRYYEDLFSGKMGYEKVAEFSSFPKIAVGSMTFFEFPDEEAEETWSVFDHPVIRIYKKS